MSSRVQTLPPTLGIKDPDVRSFLDALANAWDHRNGITDKGSPDRFITAEEFKGLASQAVVETIGSALGGGPAGFGGGAGGGAGSGSVSEVITALSEQIKKSLLYQILGTQYENINLSDLRQKINASVDQAAAFFAQEREARSSADEAITNQLEVQASQIGQAQAAITQETQTRANKDNAIASAVNNIWAAIGGNNAVIQDGQLAQVSPSGAQATKWTQVQAEVIDPNTGTSKVASIRQDFKAFSDKVTGKFGSLYTVRAQIASNGRTIVGGFGLSALDGPGGPTIDFGVRADTFWVGSVDGSGDIPFIVQGGKTYIKQAMIGTAYVDTLRIAGEAVTITRYASAFVTGRTWTRTPSQICSSTITVPQDAGTTRFAVTCFANCYPVPGGDSTSIDFMLQIRVNGALHGEGGMTVGAFAIFVGAAAYIELPPGSHTISATGATGVTSPNTTRNDLHVSTTMLIQGAKR